MGTTTQEQWVLFVMGAVIVLSPPHSAQEDATMAGSRALLRSLSRGACYFLQRPLAVFPKKIVSGGREKLQFLPADDWG